MISRFFIDRPVLASVISWMTVLFGLIALWRLPVEQYPEITPPTVRVTTTYPGASAQVVADTVAAPIEQQVNGVERMLYMSSTSSSDGLYMLTITFEIGTDLNQAQTLVQNRVQIAEPQLPEEVRRQGLVVKKQSTSIVMVVGLTSPDQSYDDLFLTNYSALKLRDELARIQGVGDVEVAGGGTYSMRVWLDAEKLRGYGLTAQDVTAALAEQNVQVAAGAVGQSPGPEGISFRYTVTAMGRLTEPKQFENTVIKVGERGRTVYLRDVARVELGAQSYDSFSQQHGVPAAALLIYQQPGSNALDVGRGVKATMERLSKQFPPGMAYGFPYDTTLFVDASIKAVYQTLLEAGVLVLIVILVFLQDWRATLVPATTVPVTIVGTFAVMYLLGFSINLLSLFGLVLAIGIVVDDAIVIVENAAHHVERGLSPREATLKAMSEVTGPVMGITLVLMAVFIPAGFMSGTTGQMYKQFALTIAATALISALNAVTLKPVQCATWLRPPPARRNVFARAFNACYGFVEWVYVGIVKGLVRYPAPVLAVFLGLAVWAGWWYTTLPKAFLPTEDQGFSIIAVQLPDAASLERTRGVVKQINDILHETPGVRGSFVLGGFSLFDQASASNAAVVFIDFEPWHEREQHHGAQSQDAILGQLNGRFMGIKEAQVFAFAPPAVLGLGLAGGFQLNVEDRDGVGPLELQQRTQEVIDAAGGNPAFGPMQTTYRATVPQLFVEIDRVKVKKLDLRLGDVFGTLQAYLGSVYVNDFNKYGRTYQVRLQAAAAYRRSADDIRRLEVRNALGRMVPLGAVLEVKHSVGPQFVTRYNLYPTATINGMAGFGVSSGTALEAMEEVAGRTLPGSMGSEWTGMAFEEKRVGNEVFVVFGLAVLMVFLVLAAQYESRLLPLAVILVVPLGLLGVTAAAWARGFANDVYTQIGVVLIIALASKNAILIVEFARELRAHGKGIREAAVEAARMRFRPILMTSFAFILGVVPLVFAHGAGAAARQSLGTAVFGGMLSATVLAVFFVPVFYVVMQGLAEAMTRKPAASPAATAVPSANGHHHHPATEAVPS